MLTADLAHAGEITLGRRIHATGADDRLAEEGGDVIALIQECGKRLGVVPRHLRDRRVQVAVTVPVGLDAGQARAGHVHAVVGVRARDDRRPLGAPHLRPVAPHELDGGIDRIGAAAGEEDLGIGHGCEGRQTLRQIEGRASRQVAERGVRRQRRHLLGNGVGDARASVADVAVPQSRRGIEVAAAAHIGDVCAFT